MTKRGESQQIIDFARLNPRSVAAFDLHPSASKRAKMAQSLGVDALTKLRFSGELRAQSARDWLLHGHLRAQLTQSCGVSMVPVKTRINENVERLYVEGFCESELAQESEMLEDDRIEAMPRLLDLMEVLQEALSLAIPSFPRAPGVDMIPVTARPPETQDQAPAFESGEAGQEKPFAVLSELKSKMTGVPQKPTHDKE